MKTLILLSLCTVAFCSPFDFFTEKLHAIKEKFSVKAAYSYAATVDRLLSTSTFNCMKQGGYSAAFIRVYQPNNTGGVDYNGIQNVRNANAVNLGVEVYATPQPQGTKSATTQFDEMYAALNNAGVSVSAIWLQVTSPINWPNTPMNNVKFITSYLSRAKQYGLYLGIYTNWYDWQQITGNYQSLTSIGDVRLWYWNAYGTGVTAASSLDFTDFRGFGSFTKAVIKQYSFLANTCSTQVNQNIFATGASKMAMATPEKDGKIRVGTIQF